VISLNFLKPYTEHEYERIERFAVALMAIGLLWAAVMSFTGWHYGLITCMASVFMGAAFGCYSTRKTERGVWMLALLIGGLTAGFYLFTIAMEILDYFKLRTPPQWWLALDVATAGMIVNLTVRASWTVIRQNRKLSA
jgi:hypothetical protein